MTEAQIEKARALKDQGWSLRKIATEVDVPVTKLFRVLKGHSAAIAQAADSRSDARTLQGSALVRSRIDDARALVATIESELEELPSLKESTLAAETFDGEALAALEEREAQLAKDKGNLEKRLILLAQQQEVEEAKEAQRHLPEIQAAAEILLEQKEPAMKALEAAVGVAIERARDVATLYAKHQVLVSEEVFLIERYRLPRLHMPQLGEPPNVAALVSEVSQVFAAVATSETENPWIRKRRQWDDQRRNRPAVSRAGGVSSQQ